MIWLEMFSSLHANCYLHVADINSYLQLPLFDNKLCQQMKELTNIAFIINFYFEKLCFCYKYTDVNINIYSHMHIFIYYIYIYVCVCVCIYIYMYIYIYIYIYHIPDICIINNQLFHSFRFHILQSSCEWFRIFCYTVTLKALHWRYDTDIIPQLYIDIGRLHRFRSAKIWRIQFFNLLEKLSLKIANSSRFLIEIV